MKAFVSICILLLVFTSTFSLTPVAQQLKGIPFHITSLNSSFGVQGDFEGEYRLNPTGVELRLTKADIYISEHCPYKGSRFISAIKFGLGTSRGARSWKILTASQEKPLELIMYPGDVYHLGELYAYIPKDELSNIAENWLVVSIEDTAVDLPDRKPQKGYSFAHSCRDIFAQAVAPR